MYKKVSIPQLTIALLFKEFCDELPNLKRTIAPDGWKSTSYYRFFDDYVKDLYEQYRYKRIHKYHSLQGQFKNYQKHIPPLMCFKQFKEESLDVIKSEDFFFLSIFARVTQDFFMAHPLVNEKDKIFYEVHDHRLFAALIFCWDYVEPKKPYTPQFERIGDSYYTYIHSDLPSIDYIPFYKILFRHFDKLPSANWSYQHTKLNQYIKQCWRDFHLKMLETDPTFNYAPTRNLPPHQGVYNWSLLKENIMITPAVILLDDMEENIVKKIEKLNNSIPHDIIYAYTDVFGDYPPGYFIDIKDFVDV